MHHPSYIFHNCTVFDGRKMLSPEVTAVAVRGGAIETIGTDKDVLHTAGPETIIIDAGRSLLLPALMDSHTHLSMYAARKLQVDLAPCRSLEEALAAVKAGVERCAEGEWVIGYGWDKNIWGDVQPTRQMLDGISTRHFISLQSKDWHSLWVNTPVLAICGIDGTSRNPAGGTILREEDGVQPSGILQENACTIVFKQIAPMLLSDLYPALKETFSEFHRYGITGVHSVETNYDFANYSQLYSEGKLGLRIFFYFPGAHLRDNTFTEVATHTGNSFLKICGAKLFMDGTLGSQTADMLQPLEGLHHTGIPVLTEDDLKELLQRAAEQGIACAIHAIGDAANRKTLDGFAGIAERSREKGLRHRIEHAQMLHPDDISRFAELNVMASVQPLHLAADIPMIERYLGERGEYAYAFKSLQQAGARLIFGSDTPVESFDPWKAIYTAIQRRYLCDPEKRSHQPKQALELEACLEAYSFAGAYAACEEENLGAIRPGRLADLVLLDKKLFDEEPEALLEVKPQLTMQNGRIVYQNF